MPRLTIAILTYNRAELLVRAIESALAQTSAEIEILVSDNGSTDETPAVLARYAGRGLRTFRHSPTMPANRHGKFLLEQVRGEFVLGLSDDDFLEPEFAAEVLAAFDRHPESAFVYTGCAIHYDDVQVPALVGPPLESGADLLANHYDGKRELCWCACVTRVRDLKELGQPEDRIIGDMFFWTKLAFRGPVCCVPRVLSHYVLLRSKKNDNISHGTSPINWARESQVLADEVLQASRLAGASPEYLSKLKVASTRHIARSTANQFVWTRIRGASLADTLRWSIDCIPYLSWTFPAIIRLGAALLLPPKILKTALMKAAARLASSRRENDRNLNR